jgi:hypothetical protein
MTHLQLNSDMNSNINNDIYTSIDTDMNTNINNDRGTDDRDIESYTRYVVRHSVIQAPSDMEYDIYRRYWVIAQSRVVEKFLA